MLAIIIPYYKLRFFEATLLSLARQTNKSFNLYIGNDASPEDPSFVLDKYTNELRIQYHYFEDNLGAISLTKQWERCLQMISDEDWVMFLGDDDVVDENCVDEFYKSLAKVEQRNINVIRFATRVINEKNEKLQEIYHYPAIEKSTDFLMRRLAGETRSSLSQYIFRKSVVREVGFADFPLAWHSDDLAILEFSNFESIYSLNSAIVYFRKSGINITSKNDNLRAKNTASFEYYYYLLKYKSSYFDSSKKNILYQKIEKAILNDKKNSAFWLALTKLYFCNRMFYTYLMLLISAIKSFLNRKK